MAAQEGSMVKRLHAGLACQTGVRASALAASGFTGIEEVFEAEFGGLLGTLGTKDSDPAALTAGLGDVWQTARIEFKRHAACAAIHTSLDVVEDLLAVHRFSASDLAEVSVRCTTHAFLHCGFDYQPAGVTAAQMSFQYCLAAMLTYGQVGVAQFDEGLLADPALLALAGRVRVVADPKLDTLGADRRHTVQVVVTTRDGETFDGQRIQRRGGADEPLTASQIVAKFDALAQHVMTPERAAALTDAVLTLQTCADARRLTDLLRAPSSVKEQHT
jgi:2-methylcitrate dehydratase PrpD